MCKLLLPSHHFYGQSALFTVLKNVWGARLLVLHSTPCREQGAKNNFNARVTVSWGVLSICEGSTLRTKALLIYLFYNHQG